MNRHIRGTPDDRSRRPTVDDSDKWQVAGLCLAIFSSLAFSSCAGPSSADGRDLADTTSTDVVASDTAADAATVDLVPPAELPPEPLPTCRGGFVATPLTAGTGRAVGEVVGDFEVMTLAGPWRLSDHWTGCDTHLFLVTFPSVPGLDRSFFKTSPELLFQVDAGDSHYHFASDAETEDARIDDLLAVSSRIDALLPIYAKTPEERASWSSRIHYIVDRARDIAGDTGPGAFIRAELEFATAPDSGVDLGDRGTFYAPPPFFFAIGPDQRLEYGDSLAPFPGAPQTLGMATYLAAFLAWRRGLEAKLAARDDTTVPLLNEVTTRRVLLADAVLPDGTSALAFDVTVACDARNPFACSEWDRIAHIALCLDEICQNRHEIARWITPYWRRGVQRYLLDVSAFLPLLGPSPRFRIELGPEWERPTPWRVRVDLRVSNDPARERAKGVIPVATGGPFDGTYGRDIEVDIPVGATRVELIALLSGHGQTPEDNCAEWCDHRHVFAIDGVALPAFAHEGPPIGDPQGCAAASKDGVLPGQWGNWAPQRAYWCPGLPVRWLTRDVTALATAGATHRVTLEGRLGEAASPRGGDIALSAYLVWY